MNRLYESVMIFDVQMTDADRDKILTDVKTLIGETGGTVTETVPFGIRKLAFDLKGRQRGDYRVVRFTSGSETLQKMDRMLRLKEEVLRYMVTKYTPPKPKKESRKKNRDESAQSEGEVTDGKSEQSVADGEHHPAA